MRFVTSAAVDCRGRRGGRWLGRILAASTLEEASRLGEGSGSRDVRTVAQPSALESDERSNRKLENGSEAAEDSWTFLQVAELMRQTNGSQQDPQCMNMSLRTRNYLVVLKIE